MPKRGQQPRTGGPQRGDEHNSCGTSSRFLLGNSGNSKNRKKSALQSGFATRGVVPFLKRVSSATVAARSDGNSLDAQRERHIRVCRRALNARLIANKLVGGTKGGQQWRIRGQFSAR